jgi:SNF2 family DNA or RNA helicase
VNYLEFDKSYGFSEKAGFQLTDKQIAAVEEAAGYGKVLLNLEVGVGKTVIATAIALMLGYEKNLVIVPPILITPWFNWLTQVGCKVVAYRGTPAKRKEIKLKQASWIVMSHDIFRRDYSYIKESVKPVRYSLILDEAHAAKSPRSVLFRCILELSAGDVGLQLLTGTPISSILDSYSYIKLKTPKAYRSYKAFTDLHVKEYDFFNNPKEFQNLDRLRENFEINTITGTKEEFHGFRVEPFFPDANYELDPAHHKLYVQLVDEQLLLVGDGEVVDVTTSQRLYQALQQVVCNWAHFSGDPSKRSAVYDIIDQTVEETQCADVSKSKLIIWTRAKMTSRSVLRYVNDVLKVKAVAAYSEVDSEKSIQAFMTDPEVRVLVGQPRSCGAGLNPQHICWEALYVELESSSILMRQSLGRLVRVGQKHIPRIKIAVAKGTIQEAVLKRLLKNDDQVSTVETSKKSVRDMLLGGD